MFDPYRKWLGIPEGERPPTHYQLLGISPDERDAEVIDAAVLRQSAYVRNFQAGKYSAEATRLLTEIAAAKLCLIDPAKRARYDVELRSNTPSAGGAAPPERAAAAASPANVPSATAKPRPAPSRPASQAPAARPAAASAPTARPQASPRRPMPASRSYAAGGLQPWAIESPALGNLARARPAAPDHRPIWIGLGVGACCVPVVLTAIVLMSRPADPSLASADGEPATEPAPANVNPYAPPPGGAAIPPVSPLVQTAPPPVFVEQSPATAPSTAEAQPDDAPFVPFVPPPGDLEMEEPFPELSPQMPQDDQDFKDRMQREAERLQREFEARMGRPRDPFNRFGKRPPEEGIDTKFIGNNGGIPQRTVRPGSHMIGVAYQAGQWGREQCLAEIKPIFSRDETAALPLWEKAREGYAVGAAKVRTFNYVNAIRLTYMRIMDDGRLDPTDSYKGEWLGFRIGKEFEISGDGDPIIGIHARRGAVLDAVALVVDRKSSKAKSRAKSSAASD